MHCRERLLYSRCNCNNEKDMRYFRTIMCSLSLLAAVSCGNGDKQSVCEADCDKEAVECTEKAAGNAVIENIMSRRSIRKYKNEPVAREVMEEIALCGINAPNGQNKQSWEVRIVYNPEFQDEIKAVMAAAGGERAAGCFYNAPVWVFIARDNGYDFSTIDCGLLAENMMLSAHSLGVGSVCLGSPVRFILTSPDKDKVLSMLGFSEGYELCLCIGFGYPDETPKAKPRNANKVKFVE